MGQLVQLDPERGRFLLVIGRYLPGLGILYMLLCAFNLPGNSWEIAEALPNGYYLEGLSKMPEYSHITQVNDLNGSPAFPGQLSFID